MTAHFTPIGAIRYGIALGFAKMANYMIPEEYHEKVDEELLRKVAYRKGFELKSTDD